jgi:hypothetical protein
MNLAMERPRTPAQVRILVMRALKRHLPKLDAVAVNVREAEDFLDGDPVWRVAVVYDPRKGEPDPRGVGALAGDVYGKLWDAGDRRFPVYRYISKTDLGKAEPEAA